MSHERQDHLGGDRGEEVLGHEQQGQPDVPERPDHLQNPLPYVAKHQPSAKVAAVRTVQTAQDTTTDTQNPAKGFGFPPQNAATSPA